jgi:Ras-related protein Rab-18
MLVGNKVDKESERAVTKKEGIEFAREYGCLFLECSAKAKVNVEQCFEELVLKVCSDFQLLVRSVSGIICSQHHIGLLNCPVILVVDTFVFFI